MILLTSDLHFGHNKPFIFEPRGYASIEEMNEDLILKWNSVVADNDEVYILGDIMLGDNEKGIDCIKRLKGKIHIILGNHDTKVRQELYKELDNVVEVAWATMLTYRKYHFYMTHFPCKTSNNDNDRPLKEQTLNLCGHTHTQNCYEEMENGIMSYHVEVDAHDGFPVPLDSIIEGMERKNKLRVFEN